MPNSHNHLGLRITTSFAILFTLVLAQPSHAPGQNTPTDAERGKTLFERRCTGCHALDTSKEGPRLRGVYGRAAAAVPGFPYSAALKSQRITWNDATLDRWLAGPDAMVPNTGMDLRVPRADERRWLIAYLRELSQ